MFQNCWTNILINKSLKWEVRTLIVGILKLTFLGKLA